MAEKILLIEDNEQNRTLMRQLLTHHGYEVLESVDGLTGLDMATVLMPDLILLDIQMPVMSGFKVIRALRSNPALKNLKVIAVTSFCNDDDRERALEAGFDEYVTKPIDTRKFPELVKEILSRERGEVMNSQNNVILCFDGNEGNLTHLRGLSPTAELRGSADRNLPLKLLKQ